MICSARVDEISLLAATQALAASLSCGTVEAPDGKIPVILHIVVWHKYRKKMNTLYCLKIH